ncbi:capsular polysaccharide export protein [Sphingomonas zeicaulis]|uniref:capsular polysaccharide export protein, LipB/KpsS family n=1 Tax=Sphingomonas zeicaulis TaxID=1632740 RepID=UPI003D1D7E62
MIVPEPLLRVPPFPGARVGDVAVRGAHGAQAAPGACVRALRQHRVGGSFWAAQPALDAGRRLVARPASAAQAEAMLERACAEGNEHKLLFWMPATLSWRPARSSIAWVSDPCDPWHLIGHAETLWADAADEVMLIARIAGAAVTPFGAGPYAIGTAEALVARHVVTGFTYVDPFEGDPSDALAIIELLGSWRRLIDSNRAIGAAVGFARWKRETVEPLLWNGSDRVRFVPANPAILSDLAPDEGLAIWKARVPEAFLAAAEAAPNALHEVEDGFIRSVGLGANCVPPLSVVVDPVGVHYDPSRPSALENLLERAEFDAATRDQAARLRVAIRLSGLSKYEVGSGALPRPGGARRHILVPGQVEDDRSVRAGGGAVAGNLDLLRRVRALNPDAFILYKPHPDVESGHRTGRISETETLSLADLVVRDAAMSQLLDMVDEVHVLTSLAGFEALLRDKPVTTHGVPFYAGWGLTEDLGDVPARRRRRRSVDDLIAAVLIAYPRYLDPLTLLPCSPEILVRRLAGGARRQNEAIVSWRRLQGALRRTFSRIGATA